MTDKQAKTTPRTETAEDVDRIRDIIFGPYIRDYDQRFKATQRDLERLQQEVDRLNEQMADQGNDQNKKLQAFRQEMRQTSDSLRDELRQTTQKMTGEYLERVALAELFIELGTRLKTGGSLADLLKDLSEKTE